MTHDIIVRVLGIALLMILVAGIILIQKSRIRKKVLCSVLLVVLLVIVYLGATLFPLEEPFLTFPTVEEAFHYKYDNTIDLIVEGKESAQIVSYSEQERGYYIAILPKTEEGWRPGVQSDIRTVSRISSPGGVVSLRRYKNTNDFYLTIHSITGFEELYDNKNTEFLSATTPSLLEKRIAPGYYCAYFDGIDDDYVLTIDGEEYTFPNVK